MPVVAVVNRKGGSGKSTLATHLAGYLAGRGTPVMLGDVDRQQSTVPWLRRRQTRGVGGAPIVGWIVDPRNTLRPPAGVAHVVLDTPAGLQGLELQRLLNYADAVLVPVTDSAFDREAAAACIAELRAHPRVAAGRVKLGVVGMRIDARTRGARALADWAEAQQVPLVATLRSAQQYVRGAEQGLTLFDLPADRATVDRAQWAPLLGWLAPVIDAAPAAPELRAPRLSAASPAASAAIASAPTASIATPGLTSRPANSASTARPLVMPAGLGIPIPAPRAERSVRGWRRVLSWLVPRPAPRPLPPLRRQGL